jgi:hypothetical protein
VKWPVAEENPGLLSVKKSENVRVNWNNPFPAHSHSLLIFAPSVRRETAAQRKHLHASFIQACTLSVIPTLPVPAYYLAVNPPAISQESK